MNLLEWVMSLLEMSISLGSSVARICPVQATDLGRQDVFLCISQSYLSCKVWDSSWLNHKLSYTNEISDAKFKCSFYDF